MGALFSERMRGSLDLPGSPGPKRNRRELLSAIDRGYMKVEHNPGRGRDLLTNRRMVGVVLVGTLRGFITCFFNFFEF